MTQEGYSFLPFCASGMVVSSDSRNVSALPCCFQLLDLSLLIVKPRAGQFHSVNTN